MDECHCNGMVLTFRMLELSNSNSSRMSSRLEFNRSRTWFNWALSSKKSSKYLQKELWNMYHSSNKSSIPFLKLVYFLISSHKFACCEQGVCRCPPTPHPRKESLPWDQFARWHANKPADIYIVCAKVMFSDISVHRSQVTRDAPPPPAKSPLAYLWLGSQDLFKFVHLEDLPPVLFKLVYLGTPLHLFKHVLYLSHASIGKRAVDLRLKDFLVSFKVHLEL